MRRSTELTCFDRPSSSLPFAVDEFTVLEEKEEELKCAKPRVEQIFKVSLTIIGLLEPPGLPFGSKTSRHIWLQLRGNREDVSKAKEYIRGLCDPELAKEERYPVDMHCIFAGAHGHFLDRLVRDTSAEVLVPEPGCLRLLGQAEPVVMALSRVQQFVGLFQEKRRLAGDREPAITRAFKSFVEERDDKYSMELLLLPSALKEELLGLVHSPTSTSMSPLPTLNLSTAELEQARSQSSTPVTEPSNSILGASFDEKGTSTTCAGGVAKAGGGLGPEVVLLNAMRPSRKRRSSASETRDTKRQYSLERRDESPERARERERQSKTPRASSTYSSSKTITVGPSEGISDDGEAVSPETSCLVNFFRTMGYQQEVVERVVKETGQTQDTFLLLEKIVEETKRCEHSPDGPSSSSSSSYIVSQYRDMEREQNRALMDPGKAQENIRRNNQQTASSTGLGHRRQYSSSETSTQQSAPADRPAASTCPTISPVGFDGARFPSAPPVTGLARFQQSLRAPYILTLPNEPGRPELRHIIIDGSNVAMAHGLHRFFSCRGIALAVDMFWRRGHREITVFVPQWCQKRDRLTTEQHFLNQLEGLRLLSFTPSREVCGQRITSHDNRFLLHLAEKTDGIIVTNNYLRDFVDMSDSWRRIIKERLLQFTFVEDHFMIPDDPLGRRGPHIDNFLRKDARFVHLILL